MGMNQVFLPEDIFRKDLHYCMGTSLIPR